VYACQDVFLLILTYIHTASSNVEAEECTTLDREDSKQEYDNISQTLKSSSECAITDILGIECHVYIQETLGRVATVQLPV
jgi:hypothetical protein